MQHDAVSNNLHAEPASSAIFNSTYGYTAVKFASDQDSCNDTSQSHSVSDRQDGVESGPGSADVSCHLHKSVDDTVVSCAALLPGSVHGDDSMPVESAAESDHEDVSHDSASNYLDAQAVVIQRGQFAVRSNSLVQSLQQAAGHHPLGLRQPYSALTSITFQLSALVPRLMRKQIPSGMHSQAAAHRPMHLRQPVIMQMLPVTIQPTNHYCHHPALLMTADMIHCTLVHQGAGMWLRALPQGLRLRPWEPQVSGWASRILHRHH